MQEMARGSDQGKNKVKSRASQPNLGGPASSAPSVPSLPSIQKTSTTPSQTGKTTSSGPRLPTKAPSKPPSNPLLSGGKQPSSPNMNPALSMRMANPSSSQLAAPGKSNTLVFALIGVLIAAIAVLAYVVLTK